MYLIFHYFFFIFFFIKKKKKKKKKKKTKRKEKRKEKKKKELLRGHGQSIRTWELRFPELRRETVCGGARASSSFRFFIFFVGWRSGTVTATESISSNTEPPIFVSFHRRACPRVQELPFFFPLSFLFFSFLFFSLTLTLYQPLHNALASIIIRTTSFISISEIRPRFHCSARVNATIYDSRPLDHIFPTLSFYPREQNIYYTGISRDYFLWKSIDHLHVKRHILFSLISLHTSWLGVYIIRISKVGNFSIGNYWSVIIGLYRDIVIVWVDLRVMTFDHGQASLCNYSL